MERKQFGSKLRLIRERRQMTLKEIAGIAGVSESLVSQIERDKVSPSLDTLLNITEALGIHPEYLFRGMDPEGEVTVTRGNEGAVLTDGGVSYRSLCNRRDLPSGEGVEVFRLEVDPGSSHGDIEYGHRGFEIGVVLEGRAVLFYGNERMEVQRGDCVSFRSDIPHTLQNPGPEKLVTLWYVSPARIFKS